MERLGVFLQSKQYSLKVYETTVGEEEKFLSFFEANHILFKDHLIVLRGEVSDRIRAYLTSKSLHFLENVTLPEGRPRRELAKELALEKTKQEVKEKMLQSELSKLTNRLENNLTVLDKMIRSGQELSIEGDLLLLNRVNSGATLTITGNLIITQVVEGAIRCSGQFMLLTASPKANIIFHGLEINNSYLEDKLNRVELKNNEVVITPVLKKDINWA